MTFGRQRAAYVVLAGLLLFRALAAGLTSVAHLLQPVWASYLMVAAVANVVLAAVALWLAPRAPDWVVDALVITASLIGIVSLLRVTVPEWHLFAGYMLLVLAVYAAYFRPRKRYLLDLVVILVGYAAAVSFGGVLKSVYLVLVLLATIGISWTVFVLVSQLRAQARTDALTGTLNRHGLSDVAGILRQEADRRGESLAIALVDLDGFKAYNDAHGHIAGDALLAKVAKSLTAGLRRVDHVARFGGDEFAILMPRSTAEQAGMALERIRDDGSAGWSYGVALWLPGEPLHIAIARADTNLYRVKRRRPSRH